MSSSEALGSEPLLLPTAPAHGESNAAQMLPPAAAAALEGPGIEEPLAHAAAAGDDSADEQTQPEEQLQQPQQPPQQQPSLDVLPNDVLSRVFVLIGAQEG